MTSYRKIGLGDGAGATSSFPMQNNFDLLRLLAALQVVYFHVQFHLRPPMGAMATPLRWVLGPLAGVPVFFIISGFLVSASFERNPRYRDYARKRILRIYPALWVCLAVTVLILSFAGQLGDLIASPRFTVWLFAHASLGQAFHLPEFRDFATGIPNASLWTISVEVLFYACVPIIYHFFVGRGKRRVENLGLVALGIASFIFATALASADPESNHMITEVFAQTPLPYLYIFLIGILCQRNFDWIAKWTVGKALWWITGYYLLVSVMQARPCTVALGWCPLQTGFRHAPVFLLSQLVLGGLVCAVAFSGRSLSERLLRGNDVSYGTYLFHMLFVNLIVAASVERRAWVTPLVVIASVGAGWVSWRAVERPVLRRWRSDTNGRRPAPRLLAQ